MKNHSEEFEKFDAVMGGLLAVPRSELNQKLAAEQKAKEKKKRSKTASSRVSASRKGRGT
jgi:hypothetical protein